MPYSAPTNAQAPTASQSGALPHSEALVDLTGPTAGVQPEKPETVDLTEEVSIHDLFLPGHACMQHRMVASLQCQTLATKQW